MDETRKLEDASKLDDAEGLDDAPTMDDTRELIAGNLLDVAQASSAALGRLSAVLARSEGDFETVANAILESLLQSLEFDRGFLLIADPASRPPEDEPAQPSWRVEVSRSRSETSPGSWQSVRNPEFAVSRSVVKRAWASSEVMVINDCLLQPTAGEEQHHAVLCQAFRLTEKIRGVVYLDRSLGRGGLGPRLKARFSDTFQWCLPVLAQYYLAGELARLESQLDLLKEESQTDGDEAGESELPAEEIREIGAFHGIVGQDEKLIKIFQIIERIRDSELNVCIFGESGTGKELVARAIHNAGRRSEHDFVSENCGAISENLLESELFGHVKGAFTGADEDRVGLFEAADGGTLFLDEIGDMSEVMQRKLLRVLQEGTVRPIGGKKSHQVDVRVICASNRDLKHLVQLGQFRADLYYRLNVITIDLPPLRERRGDIPALAESFLAEISKEEGKRKRLSQSAMKALLLYGWPGNVRELRNVIRRAALTCQGRLIARKDVMPFLSGGASSAACLGENLEREADQLILRIPLKQTFNEIIDECERLVLQNALKENGWNKSRVTKTLGIPRQSLYNKISKYGLNRDEDEGEASSS